MTLMRRPGPSPAGASSPAAGVSSSALLGGGRGGGPALDVAPRRRRGLSEDRVDQLGLAQPAEALEAELVGDRVQVGERAGLQLGAVEYGHGHVSFWMC